MTRCSILVVIALAAVAASHTRAAQPPSVHVLGTLMPEEEELASMTTAALRAELQSVRADNSRLKKRETALKKELEECEANCAPSPNKPSQHQRALSTTPAPTPLTPVPSSVPSISPAPTSMEYFELAAAVADATKEEIIVEADVMFPSQSPIVINSSRSVSIVGRSAEDGGRVTLDGLGASRFFAVDGGTLHLTHLNLVNGSAPKPWADFDQCAESEQGDLYLCHGGFILVKEDGELVVTSCDIRGRGRHGVSDAVYGGGVYVLALRTTVSFFNVTFEALSANDGAAVRTKNAHDDGMPNVITFRQCQFLRNLAPPGRSDDTGVMMFSNYQHFMYLYDCQFLNNEVISIGIDCNVPSEMTLRSCTFRANAGVFRPFPESGAALMLWNTGSIDAWDCVFENNVGPADEGSGGALSVSNGGRGTVTNSTFIANTAFNGGAISVRAGGSLTIIGCYARANVAFGIVGGTFLVNGGTFAMLNSTVTESSAIYSGVGYLTDSAIVNIEHSFFTNHRADYGAGFGVTTDSSLSMTDCINRDSEITTFTSYIYALDGSTVNALRCIFQDIRTPHIGPVYLRGSTGYFEDCDFIDNYISESYGTGGVIFLRPGVVPMLHDTNSHTFKC